ncbi:MAG: lysylphosphatidylglycerol synthase transmembrane domain-containing protein [Candidatus Aminicenantia bacterium]
MRSWIWKTLVLVIVTGALLFLFLRNTNWSEMLYHLSKITFASVIFFSFFTALNFVIRAIRWKFMLASVKKIKFRILFNSIVIGFSISYTLPGRIGEIARPVILGLKENISRSYAFGTVVMERILDILSVLFLYSVFVSWSFISGNKKAEESALFAMIKRGSAFALIFVAIFITVAFLLLKKKHWLEKFLMFITKPFPSKIRNEVMKIGNGFVEGINFFSTSGRNTFYSILFSIILWLCISLSYYSFLRFSGVKENFILTFPYILILAIGASIPTPGMVGSFHAASRIALVAIFQLDRDLAVGYTLVMHLLVVGITVLLGTLASWQEGLNWIKIKMMREME